MVQLENKNKKMLYKSLNLFFGDRINPKFISKINRATFPLLKPSKGKEILEFISSADKSDLSIREQSVLNDLVRYIKNTIPIIILILLPVFVQAQCKGIIEEKDKFDGTITRKTPLGQGIMLFQIEQKEAKLTYVRANVSYDNLLSSPKGFWLLLEDGTVISDEALEVSRDYYVGRYHYSCYLMLSPQDTEAILESPISEFKVYILEDKIKSKYGAKLQEWLRCLTN
jgi:hypothetical protein